MNRFLLLLVIAVTFIAACRKKPDEVQISPVNDNGAVRITIDQMAGNEPLILNKKWYRNANGDSLQFTTFNYFISNIKFVKDDGSNVAEMESYHLIKTDDAGSQRFEISIPPGSYKQLQFMIGVDSARNVSGAQTGDLRPENGMFWDWFTGYIMAKIEGISPQSSNNNAFAYHMGGYKGTTSSIRYISLKIDLQKTANFRPTIHIRADALELFKTPNLMSVYETPFFMTLGVQSVKMADNYMDMFTIDHID